ncbi:hypothetical protein G7Y89_g14907 [Cudoniella acicularis]|uniref:Uncharacterized protein n=1 Tax=Cudoniella acicularis TaxID=354080 RepID=A0A8H4QVP8_9HELO|nr:hypothetical protein G7Y89_g14907 [Cudoniella acicularis]
MQYRASLDTRCYNSIQTSIRQNTPYSSLPNISDSMRDEMWNSINIDRAVVVIDQKEVERLGLPADEAQRFIWDSTKRVYVVNAFHQLHCLELLFSPEDPYANIGDGHIRQCKDFSKLEEWVLAPERNACYTFYEIQDGQQENEEWRHCPPDSPYFQNMRKYFGYPEGWLPDYTLHLGPTFPPVKG